MMMAEHDQLQPPQKGKKRRKRSKCSGRTERLRHKIDVIQVETKGIVQQLETLKEQNGKLKKSLLKSAAATARTGCEQQRTSSIGALFGSSLMNSAVKPSLTLNIPAGTCRLNDGVRHFSKSDIIIHKESVLGQGVFGKSFIGSLGPNCVICVKILRNFGSSFCNEVNILLKCCHKNVCYILGVCLESRHKMILLNFHGVESSSYLIHSLLLSSTKETPFEVSSLQWQHLLKGFMAGLHYIHEKSIIHNDIKEDNVVIDMADGEFNAIIIDFGKASLDGQGKKYTLTDSDRKLYKTRHPC